MVTSREWFGRVKCGGKSRPGLEDTERVGPNHSQENDTKWLSKRMMAKRGDPVAKAFAGSLHACHDEEFTTVGKFSSGSFGSASFVRRGDGKQGYLAGLQNFSNLTLRMLPWKNMPKEECFFLVEGGFRMHWTRPLSARRMD